MKKLAYIAFLSLLAMFGYLASDMYLPAMPLMVHDLHTTKEIIQLTISVYLIGFGIGQLFYGILSDRFGRKPLLLSGLLLFVFASIGCYLSTHITVLLTCRLLQALGVCSATVLWQAMILDKHDKKAAHHFFAIIMPMLALSPALAPVIGGFLTDTFGWRIIFLVLALLASITWCIALCLKETTTQSHRDKHRIKLPIIFSHYKTLLRSPHFLGHVIIVCLGTSCFFSYLAGSPFEMHVLHLDAHEIGLSYIPQTILFMLGGFLSKKLADRLGTFTILSFALLMTLTCSLLFLWFGWQHFHGVNALILPFLLIATANGIIYPTCLSIALNHFPDLSGTAAGLSGFLQAFTAFVSTVGVAAISRDSDIGMLLVIFTLSILSFPILYWVYRKTRQPDANAS